MNLGFTIRGMDLAVASGEAAAKAVLSAMKTDDFSKQNLNQYLTLLNEGPLRDMKMYQKCLSFWITLACFLLIQKWQLVLPKTLHYLR